jgi:hypothetical protein
MEQFLSFTLVGACCPLLLVFYHFREPFSFQLCNNGLCTSSDVEARFNYPLSQKFLGKYRKDRCVRVLDSLFLTIFTDRHYGKPGLRRAFRTHGEGQETHGKAFAVRFSRKRTAKRTRRLGCVGGGGGVFAVR